MLLGRPPFETTNLKETYRCIREARYTMPSSLLAPAKHLIASMLSKNPEDRPRLDDIVRHEFFVQVGVFPGSLSDMLWMPVASRLLTAFLTPHRASLPTDSPPAAATRSPISTCPAPQRISLGKPQLLFLVAKKTKQDTLTHTVSLKTSHCSESIVMFKLDPLVQRGFGSGVA